MQQTDLEGFNEFWSVYPRRIAKLAAMKMYKRALKLTTSEVILTAAKKYAAERQGKDMNFTAHPATWLNAGRWSDYEEIIPTTAQMGFYASFTSPELDAWDAYHYRHKGNDAPRDKRGGWYFPTQWPPSS